MEQVLERGEPHRAALAERVGDELVVASYLRDRSELWVAQVFSELEQYHHVFRSCNRAFAQAPGERATQWCGECDKCLFVNLVLAPFLSRPALWDIFSCEPLSDPARAEQLRTLVGLGAEHKPFECVGDPDESAVALTEVSHTRVARGDGTGRTSERVAHRERTL